MNSTNFEPTERDEMTEATPGDGAADRSEYGVVRMADLTAEAVSRIRRFLSDGVIRGGSAPADIADLYLAHEVCADPLATQYLDRRYVHGEMPGDWRVLIDALAEAYFGAPPNISSAKLLERVERDLPGERRQRSIFDDPDDLDEYADDVDGRAERLEDRDPTLGDLTDGGRQSIERMVVADVLCYGIAPYRVMEIRERLREAGDERALQYLDLPFELGDRPPDWDRLRDEALMLRARFERRGQDSADAYASADGQHSNLSVRDLMAVLEEQTGRR